MNQYDMNINKVMKFLIENNYGSTSKHLHKICYENFKSYLKINKQAYSFENAQKWLEINQNYWTYRKYTGYKHCLEQLEDIFSNGDISLAHISPQVSDYTKLSNKLREELDEYLNYALINGLKETDLQRRRRACSRFMIYLQKHNIESISNINYQILLSFYNEDFHRTSKSKDIYNNLIRAMLSYFASIEKCRLGHTLILNKFIIPKIIYNDNFIDSDYSICNSKINIWPKIKLFVDKLREIGYRGTVIKTSKYTLTLLYIFLDMHNLNFTEEFSWYWFNKVKPLLKTNWKQVRRTITQFIYFMKNNSIITKVTGDVNAKFSIDLLPMWCKQQLMIFLSLKEKEGMVTSTLTMYKSSLLRFFTFIVNNKITDFNDITPMLLQDFNTNDMHSSIEGKSAYNSRIRNFLIYLNDTKVINKPFLHNALPIITAPKTKIISVLNKDDIYAINSFHINHNTPIKLRATAILMIGLNLGLRASDIVSIKFSDIDWTKRSISIIQQKTQKNITLPLPIHVGNAIYKYIKNGRPKQKCQYIFIKHSAPYGKLSPAVCRKALQTALPHKKPGGFHILRKTFATNLLRSNSKVTLISDALGHNSNFTVNKYLSLDEDRMRICALSLNDVNIPLNRGDF
ncbi:tyrosine-type recombinase/integrase [Clostridium butyricum]|uniref:tyrosine-type recombinase/integrase n=1 Tax=Clostridium butyricum TaxID=1492 RepID=UPI0028FD8651|nr:tyrosine-type recombinase/integrase [Clostridium butyricum]MDU0322960.1 tyrosine-type recombinase/integrase [Clostridium butyricum]